MSLKITSDIRLNIKTNSVHSSRFTVIFSQRRTHLVPPVKQSTGCEPHHRREAVRTNRFQIATAIDLSQSYYIIPLNKKSQRICTTILPWGKYTYKRLPMGIACAQDIFQPIMMDLLGNLDYVYTHIYWWYFTTSTPLQNGGRSSQEDESCFKNNFMNLASEQIYISHILCNKR